MRRVARWLGVYAAVFAAIVLGCIVVGSLVAHFKGGVSYAHAIAWTMWLTGGILVLLVALSGSPARMAAESKAPVVLMAHDVAGSDIPQPTSPFILIPVGLLVIGLGALIFMTT